MARSSLTRQRNNEEVWANVHYDRPSLAARGRRTRAKLIPHSHRRRPTHPDPVTGRAWPPRGWTEAGIRDHEISHARVVAFLSTWGAADNALAHCGRISVTAARLRELAQFGRDRTSAAAVLEDATTTVLDLRTFARADTHPIPHYDALQHYDPQRISTARPARHLGGA